MPTICAKCGKRCARTWKERFGSKVLCRECFAEGYHLHEVEMHSGRKVIAVWKK